MRLVRCFVQPPTHAAAAAVQIAAVQAFDTMPTTVFVRVVTEPGAFVALQCRTVYCNLRAYDAVLRELPKVLHAVRAAGPAVSLRIIVGDVFVHAILTGAAPCPTNSCEYGLHKARLALRKFPRCAVELSADAPVFAEYRRWAEEKYNSVSRRIALTGEKSGAAVAAYLDGAQSVRGRMGLWPTTGQTNR